MTAEMVQIRLGDKTDIIHSLVNAIKRQFQTKPLNTFKSLSVKKKKKKCLNFEGFIKDVAMHF